MAGALVRFICISPDHARARVEPEGSVLTIVAGEWAFCAAGGKDPHDWEKTAGLDVSQIRGPRRRREPIETRSAAEAR